MDSSCPYLHFDTSIIILVPVVAESLVPALKKSMFSVQAQNKEIYKFLMRGHECPSRAASSARRQRILSLFSSVESRQFNLQPEILRLFRHYGHQDDLHQDLSKTINSMKTVYSPGGKSLSLYSKIFGPCLSSPTRRY